MQLPSIHKHFVGFGFSEQSNIPFVLGKFLFQDFKTRYLGQPLEKRIHLVPSITFPNLQQPVNNSRILGGLESRHQGPPTRDTDSPALLQQ